MTTSTSVSQVGLRT